MIKRSDLIRELRLIKFQFEMRWKYRRYFLLHKETMKLTEKILASDAMKWRENDNFRMLCICILAITLTKMRSILTLCKSCLAKDATILLRVLFEDISNFNYMHSDKRRIQNFIDYEPYLKIKFADMLTSTDNIQADVKQLLEKREELQQEWDRVKHRFAYTSKKGRGKFFKTWSGKNLEEISRELNNEVNYNYLYRYLSIYVHLTPATFNDHVLGRDKNGLLLEIGKSEKYIPEVIVTACILEVEMIAKVINQEYSLGLDKEIECLAERIKNLRKY